MSEEPLISYEEWRQSEPVIKGSMGFTRHPNPIYYKKQYDESLKDGTVIGFYKVNTEGPISDDDSDGDTEEELPMTVTVDGVDYVNGIDDDYLDRIAKGEDIKILYEDKIVYPCNSITILYDYPVLHNVVMEIHATVDSGERLFKCIGFTMKQLIVAIFKYYRMIRKLHFHYNLDTGEFSEEVRHNSPLFNCCMGDDWFENGIAGLRYHKTKNQWEVIWEDDSI